MAFGLPAAHLNRIHQSFPYIFTYEQPVDHYADFSRFAFAECFDRLREVRQFTVDQETNETLSFEPRQHNGETVFRPIAGGGLFPFPAWAGGRLFLFLQRKLYAQIKP